MRRPADWMFVAAWSLLLCMPACHKKPVVVGPVGPQVSEELIQDYVAQGDEFYQAMHLYAWRKAESAYTIAYGLAPRPEIREKLALVKLLRMTREIDEDIACPTVEEDVRFICESPADERTQGFCDLARGYAAGPVAAAEAMKRVDAAAFQTETSPLDAYFYALHARTFGSEAKDDAFRKQLYEKYKDSPLFMYLSLNLNSSRVTQQFPDFAEAWEFAAESSFQRNQIRAARNGFAEALSLIPDYTRAQNGLANIYFFTLEDYANALQGYEKALHWDAQNTGALFGKGAALHHLDHYKESNEALDQMLASDLSRNGRVTANSIQYYRGEAYYYKAYNCHLMRDPAQARLWINEAKKNLPQAEEINYLSGLLYYIAGELEAARRDFLAASRAGRNCYAYHYLGLIDLKTGGPTAPSQFLSCGACLEKTLRALQQNVQAAMGLDVEPAERAALQSRMARKLAEYRDSSVDLIGTMVGLIRDRSMDENWKKTYLEAMSDLLLKVKAVAVR